MDKEFNHAANRNVLILNLRHMPGRINAGQAAAYLGFQEHDLPLLIKAGLLKPLGGGPRNTVKYFASVEIQQLATDKRWLDRATKAVSRRKTWQRSAAKNGTAIEDGSA
jgi:hypothetical protein